MKNTRQHKIVGDDLQFEFEVDPIMSIMSRSSARVNSNHLTQIRNLTLYQVAKVMKTKTAKMLVMPPRI